MAKKASIKIKVLIIGSDGMLGQELVKTFKHENKYRVFAWDKIDIDITQEKEVISKINKLKPAIIINAAAYNAVDRAEESKKEFLLAKKLNGKAPGYLAKIAKKIGAILIHYSTDYVFDGITKTGFNENAEPSPISNYGISKLLGEKNIKKNTKKYYIIRLSKLFGKPAKIEGAKKSFFDIILALASQKNQPNNEIKIVDEETSCFTYAPDLAKQTKEIIKSHKPFGVYHVTNSDPCTWYKASIELLKQARIKTKIIPVSSLEFPRPAKRPPYSVLLNTKLDPLRSYKEALEEYLAKI